MKGALVPLYRLRMFVDRQQYIVVDVRELHCIPREKANMVAEDDREVGQSLHLKVQN